jgi:serine/threonine-protein kinase
MGMNASQHEQPYGQSAVSLGYATEAQVQECVQIQARMREMGVDEPLGEIMVKKGILTAQHHSAILKKLGVHVSPIPGYTLIGKIGQGGMGTVYKAIQTSVNRTVAIKILSPQATKDKTYVTRFFQEAHAAGQLNHKNLITAIDAGAAGGLYYFAMEYVTGRSCRDLLNTKGPFEERKALDLALQMAEVLDHIHLHKLVHRDIKPENILLTPEGTVKLCDLGLAKSTAPQEQSLTQEGLAVGTPYFMSPEQVRGDKDVDIRADLYSLGASLFFLTTGRHPYEGKSAAETMSLHLNAPVPDPRKAAPLSEDFAHVIQKLMAKDRGERYQKPADLLDDLKKIQTGSAPHHAREHAARALVLRKAHATQRLLARRRAKRWPIALAGAGVAVAALGVLAATLGGSPADGGRPVAVAPPAPRPPEKAPEKPPEGPREDPRKVGEASRIFALAEGFVQQGKWAEALPHLLRLQAEFASLQWTAEHSSQIGRMIGDCQRHVDASREAQQKLYDQAQLALRESRWKDALDPLRQLADAGRAELQREIQRCQREIEAEALLAEVQAARDAGRWADLKAKILDVGSRYRDTRGVQQQTDALLRLSGEATRELEAESLVSQAQTAAQSALVTNRWLEVSERLAELDKRHDTQTYRLKEKEIADVRNKLRDAAVRQGEDLAKQAWVAALQAYEGMMGEKRYEEAAHALRAFARDHAKTKFYDAKAPEIEAKTRAAETARKNDHNEEAKKLWAVVQTNMKPPTPSFETAYDAIVRLLGEFGDTQTVKTYEKQLLAHKKTCEDRGKVAPNVLIEIDFEDYPGAWTVRGNATAANGEECHQGKRAARMSLPNNSNARHPLLGMTARAETISFWARSRTRTIAVVDVILTEEEPGMWTQWVKQINVPTEWRQFVLRFSDFRLYNDPQGNKGKKTIQLAKIGSLTFSPGDDSGNVIDVQVDTLRVEAARGK